MPTRRNSTPRISATIFLPFTLFSTRPKSSSGPLSVLPKQKTNIIFKCKGWRTLRPASHSGQKGIRQSSRTHQPGAVRPPTCRTRSKGHNMSQWSKAGLNVGPFSQILKDLLELCPSTPACEAKRVRRERSKGEENSGQSQATLAVSVYANLNLGDLTPHSTTIESN